jgi:hypothetical protein
MTIPRALSSAGVSFAEFWQAFVRLPNEGGELVCPVPHREQVRYISAVDAVDPLTGRRRYPVSFLHWRKKAAKGFTASTRVLHHFVADPFVRDERRIGIASFDEDQSHLIFDQCRQLVDRHPWLKKQVRVLRAEMIYVERCRDPRTGGTFTREHRLQALPRDLKGTHGVEFSLIIRDELWTEPDHTFSEALIISPTRAGGEVLHLSYFSPRTMMRPGVPFFDLLQRAQAGDPEVFYSYLGGAADDGIVPWITPAWVESQRKMFTASPARFRRVILNEPAGADEGLITAEEISDATVARSEPQAGDPTCTYFAAVDLGVVNDFTCVMIGHLDTRNRLVVDVVKVWRGSRSAPVSLMAVQDCLLDLHRRFRLQRLHVDQWQARHLVEGLQHANVPAHLITFDAGLIDKLVTKLKDGFSRRLISIPASATVLIEQLESVTAIESGRRRDLLRFEPAESRGHDDCVVALALMVDMVGAALGGQPRLPDSFDWCIREFNVPNFTVTKCYLAGVGGTFRPHPDISRTPSCGNCAGHLAVVNFRRAHMERTGEAIDLMAYYNSGHVQPNNFIARIGVQQWADGMGL